MFIDDRLFDQLIEVFKILIEFALGYNQLCIDFAKLDGFQGVLPSNAQHWLESEDAICLNNFADDFSLVAFNGNGK